MHQKALEKPSLQRTQRLNAKITPESPHHRKSMPNISKIPTAWGMNSWVRFQVGDSLFLVEEKVWLEDVNQTQTRIILLTQQVQHLGTGSLHCLSAPQLPRPKAQGELLLRDFSVYECSAFA